MCALRRHQSLAQDNDRLHAAVEELTRKEMMLQVCCRPTDRVSVWLTCVVCVPLGFFFAQARLEHKSEELAAMDDDRNDLRALITSLTNDKVGCSRGAVRVVA